MGKLTPMMAQYMEVKKRHRDCVLMFRLGDFYEMFFEDAEVAAGILGIALTARNKGGGEKVPMCGVPFHAVENYLGKLTRAGRKVAICDQVTVPDGRGIVEREVTRIVTPGTTFDDNILEQKTNNYVMAVAGSVDKFGLAYADITTGEFWSSEFLSLAELKAEVKRVRPAECVFPENDAALVESFGADFSKFEHKFFGEPEGSILKHFGIKSLKVFGLEGHNLATKAAAILLDYLLDTQKNELKHVQKIGFYEVSDTMPLDESCIRNLELFFTNEGKREGSLAWVLDQTATAMGGRLLKKWILKPLLKKADIESRHQKVEVFVKNESLLSALREELKQMYDIERLISRLSLGSGNGRDLLALKISLDKIPEIKKLLGKDLSDLAERIDELTDLRELIERAISEEAPISVREGGIIANGYNRELDELRGISSEGKGFLEDLQKREAKRTGISSLKVKFNKVFGYYIEISKANLASVPEDYIRKQTLVNAERFITPELKEYEEKVLTAEDRIKELEYELFYEVRMKVVEKIRELQELAAAVAESDVLADFAEVAVKQNFVRPEMFEDGRLKIEAGRHPVVEKMSFSNDFVPNDCEIDDAKNFLLITGPNMGGKSTYLRQVALCALMAQIGSFVPARNAEIGAVDRIFTRVGASDNLARGESTFMVEMQEAAYILNNATKKSLIILDEIGRGTSTYDGVSIAWAISEFLHDNVEAKTLFATHYHELVELVEGLKRGKNLSVLVRENEQEGVVFLYQIVEGGVDKSYGIEVAKLAGLPVTVVSRARGVLNELEKKHIKKSHVSKDQITMFEERKQGNLKVNEQLMNEIQKIDLNNMTPLEAIKKLDEIKKKI